MRGKLKQPPMPAGSGGVRMRAHLGSLRARLVLYVFCIMTMASLFTSAAYVVMLSAGWLRPLFITQMMSPIWMVCVSSIIGTVITAWIGKYYLSPVTQVIAATKRVAKGDFSVQLPMEDGRGEMGDLVRSFNRMTRELGGIEMFRSDFINSFSHEFKTPIVSIRGFARQLQRDDITDEERREYATIIADESTRLANLATNILLLSKLENQQIVTEKTAFRLDEQLRSCILLLEKQWEQKHLELVIDLEEVTCYGNAEMLSQAWVNLINNAIKFTPEGGTIGISMVAVDDTATVQVSDTGIGMDRETQQHIFEKFYQGDKSHHGEGNGLGLAMVKRIIALSCGKITVDSVKGKGTTFTVQLPVKG